MSVRLSTEVLVIGAGPAGASAAYWAAKSGRMVVLLEKDVIPRDKADVSHLEKWGAPPLLQIRILSLRGGCPGMLDFSDLEKRQRG